MKNNDIVKVTFLICLLIVAGVCLTLTFITMSPYPLLIGAIPSMTFFIIFIFMDIQRKKVERILNESFGQNVVKIATSIMTYFEIPLTLLLTLTLTLFIFCYALIFTIFWAQVSVDKF